MMMLRDFKGRLGILRDFKGRMFLMSHSLQAKVSSLLLPFYSSFTPKSIVPKYP